MPSSSSTCSTVSLCKSPVPDEFALVSTDNLPPFSESHAASASTSRKEINASMTGTTSSSGPSAKSSVQYYGHKETSLLCARYVRRHHPWEIRKRFRSLLLSPNQITSLFHCPDIPPAKASMDPTPTLALFVAYALHRTRHSSTVAFAALLLLRRLKTRFPAARGSFGHRLFITSFMIASKVLADDTYSNQSWAKVAQNMFALNEISHMELEMCTLLEWNLNIQEADLLEFETGIYVEYGSKAL